MNKPVVRVGAAIAALLLVLATVTGLLWHNDRTTAAALDDHGITTIATVDTMHTDTRRVRTSDGTRRETDYLVTYVFDAVSANGGGAREQRIEHEVPRSVYDQLSTGQAVEIRYLPEDPARADFYPGESLGAARVMGWVSMMLLLAAVTALGSSLWLSRRAPQGHPVHGTCSEHLIRHRLWVLSGAALRPAPHSPARPCQSKPFG